MEESKAPMAERVTTLGRLVELANEGRCVFVDKRFKYKPAAFVVSMQGRLINQLFELGMYVYQKEEKTK